MSENIGVYEPSEADLREVLDFLYKQGFTKEHASIISSVTESNAVTMRLFEYFECLENLPDDAPARDFWLAERKALYFLVGEAINASVGIMQDVMELKKMNPRKMTAQ